jgi:nucleoside 2-deoxyribosyltransferase
VYYEAGFALGLGKAVISSCNKDDLESLQRERRPHFDVAHLNMVPWTQDGVEEYRSNLENRILAVLGRGPIIRP